MSNFVTGLVRRGAGLPPRVSIRPATGPLQMPASPAAEGLESRQGITSFPARALSDRDFGLDVRRPDSAVPAEPARLQIPRPTAAPEPVNPRSEERSLNTEETPSLQLRSEPVNRRSGKSSPRTEETLTLQPRSEPPKKAPVATAQLRSEDRSSARTGDAWRLVPQSWGGTATPPPTNAGAPGEHSAADRASRAQSAPRRIFRSNSDSPVAQADTKRGCARSARSSGVRYSRKRKNAGLAQYTS
jgi:hypothetical protein